MLQDVNPKKTRKGSDPIPVDELDKILPDVPEDHPLFEAAQGRVTWASDTLSYRFIDKKKAGSAGQATIAQVGGSCNAASRIARLMYVKSTEEGADNSLDLFAYRDQLYRLITDSFPDLPCQDEVVLQYKKSRKRGLKRPASAASRRRGAETTRFCREQEEGAKTTGFCRELKKDRL